MTRLRHRFHVSRSATLLVVIGCISIAFSPTHAQVEFLQVVGSTSEGGADPHFGETAVAGDFNGDGHLDLVIGAPFFGASNEGAVLILNGPFASGAPANGVVPIHIPASAQHPATLGTSLAVAPTFRSSSNGIPGLPEVFIGSNTNTDGKVLKARLDPGLPSSWIAPDSYVVDVYSFGRYMTVCDFNNDSFDDLVLRSGNASGRVYVYLGGDGADALEDIIISPLNPSSSFGKTLCGVPDVTGDGRDDLIIGDNFVNKVHIVFGRTNIGQRQVGQEPLQLVITGASDEPLVNTATFARVRAAAGGYDLTGDGAPDIVLASEQSADVMVYEGLVGEDGLPGARTTFLGTSTFGSSLAVGGDVDGDGFSDLLIADKGHTPYGTSTGRVTIALGGTRMDASEIPCGDVPTTRNVWQLQPAGMPSSAWFGSAVGFLGDQVGSDGKDEIFVGAPGLLDVGNVVAGKVSGFNLSASAIEIADVASPIPAGPSCTGPRVFAVQIDVPQDVTIGSVVANSATLGLLDAPLTDLDGDGIYTATLAGIYVPPSGATVEVFANATAVSGGFAIKDVHVPASPSPLVAPIAEYPLSKSSPAPSLLAVRVSPCGGAPTRVTLDDPTGFYWNLPDLTDQGPPGDLVANDGIWSYSGSETAIVLPPPGFYDFNYVVYYPDSILSGTVEFQVIEPTDVSYVNKSSGTGLNYAGQPYSGVAIDFSAGPGPKDLFISMLDDRGALYKCRFVSSAGVPEFQIGDPDDTGGSLPPTGLLGLTVADFNNDGREDLFAAAQSSARLYRAVASGDPVLQDVTIPLIPSSAFANSLTGAWGDYDRDGRLDLFVGRGIVIGEPGVDSGTPANGVLLHNDTRSGGGFVDVSASTGVGDVAQYAVTATWGDINGDKFPDLFVGDASASGTASRLFRNGKDGGFVDEANGTTVSRLGGDLNSVVGASFGDVDADGDLDLIVATSTGAEIRQNTNSGTYTTVVPVGAASSVSGVNVYDFDYNGVQDVLLLSADAAATPKLFKGASSGGSLSFSDVTSAVGLNWSGKVGGSVLSDFNSDGDLDLYLGRAVAQGAHFFTAAGVDPTTDAYTSNWQQVQLVSNIGVPNSYRGVGAKVTVTQGANSFVRVVDGGSGRGGQSDSILEFGLPTSAAVSDIQVEWPNGYVQNYANPATRFVTIADDTKLFTITKISGGHQIVPCTDLSRWTFSWVTSFGTNPDLDRVVYKIGDSNVFSGGTEVAATDAGVAHASYVKSAGGYQHDFSFVAPCALNETVYFAVISKGHGEVIGATKSFAITVCGTPCDPNQQ